MDNYHIFKRSFIELLDVQDKTELRSMQLVSFTYGGSNEQRLALILDVFPDSLNIHAIKLNHLTLGQMNAFFNTIADIQKVRLYSESFVRNVLGDVLRLHKYRLPLIAPESVGSISFYNTYIKGKSILKQHNAYRQYNLDKMENLQLVVPNLKFLDLMPRSLRVDGSYTDADKSEFINEQKDLLDTDFELGVEQIEE